MNEQERALWAAVYVAAMGKEVDCHEVATQAVREMRSSEAILAAETKTAEEALRGEPPFKADDLVRYGGVVSSVVACNWVASTWMLTLRNPATGALSHWIPDYVVERWKESA